MSDAKKIGPRAFYVDDAAVDKEPGERRPTPLIVETTADPFEAESVQAQPAAEERAIEAAQQRGILRSFLWSWSGLFWSSIGALASIAIGLWIDNLIDALFDRYPLLGWIALAFVIVAGISLAALAFREALGIFRQKRIAALHARLSGAHLADDRQAARQGLRELVELYETRPETAAARSELVDLSRQIVDARDLLEIAERRLVKPLDQRASREIALAAKRVSAVTTLSPRALFDLIFVAAQAARLVRKIAEIYGGRPGFLGLVRLSRSVAAHLAITGGMAVGDSLVQQIVGHGVAARISARLGEGVLNGLLTARVGLSAIAVCRPLPFLSEKQPTVADVAPFLFSDKGKV